MDAGSCFPGEGAGASLPRPAGVRNQLLRLAEGRAPEPERSQPRFRHEMKEAEWSYAQSLSEQKEEQTNYFLR